MIPTIIHLVQLIVHTYFMYINFDSKSIEEFWNQIKYLTNISNLCMYSFLIPQVIEDIKFIRRRGWLINIPRHHTFTHYAYQCMNPIIFIVMTMFWTMFLIDPKLIFADRDITQIDMVLMFYVHGGNWILMQLNQFEKQPHLKMRIKGLIYFVYVILYFGIYGLHYLIYEQHVYGFQALLSKFELVSMYAILFATLFGLDVLYNKVLFKPRHNFVQIKNH
ncbi:unnamed protein product [Paramecium pentaurelia]|uniref:Uncharacterized protein n=1 Tax=Paramecium pentaurelia TaxID=43138 RepID=A0A8S1Y0Y6_9CILI|nr:unnamed protein product [Paramecium pentaurelia]